MNGRMLFDTNAIIGLLKGNPSLQEIFNQAETTAVSIISKIEYLAFSEITNEDRNLLNEFVVL